MQGGPTKDAKKTICRTFTNVLKASPLKESINPKEFYMMMSTNFAVLYQNGRLELSPIWGALAPNHSQEHLIALFLEFGQAGENIGVEVVQPSAINALTPEQIAQFTHVEEPGALQSFSQSSDSIAELEALSTEDLRAALQAADAPLPLSPDALQPIEEGAPIPLPLGTGDLRPVVPEEQRRKIIQIILHAVKNAPIGAKMNSAQLGYQLDSEFDELCDGSHFNFEPVLIALRQLEGYQDADVYGAIVVAQAELEKLGISMDEPAMELHPDVKKRLQQEAQNVSKPRISSTLAQARSETPPPPPPTEVKNKSADRLKKWGLSGKSSGRGKKLRIGLLSLVGIGALTVLFLNRPNRPVDETLFKDTIPLKSAGFKDGYFMGVVKDTGWYNLTPKVRAARVKAFVDRLRNKGWAGNAQLYDTKKRLVLTNADNGRLVPAAFFVKGKKDGSVPKAPKKSKKTPKKPKTPKE